jgi:hypothetical protein
VSALPSSSLLASRSEATPSACASSSAAVPPQAPPISVSTLSAISALSIGGRVCECDRIESSSTGVDVAAIEHMPW